jgi:hypothetical protein
LILFGPFTNYGRTKYYNIGTWTEGESVDRSGVSEQHLALLRRVVVHHPVQNVVGVAVDAVLNLRVQ